MATNERLTQYFSFPTSPCDYPAPSREDNSPTHLHEGRKTGTPPGHPSAASEHRLHCHTSYGCPSPSSPCAGPPFLLAAGNQSCTQYLFPMQTHGRFMQQSITVLWVWFFLCFKKNSFHSVSFFDCYRAPSQHFHGSVYPNSMTRLLTGNSQVRAWHCLWM